MDTTHDTDTYQVRRKRDVGLPGERFAWPVEARAALRELQRQLDRWCRDRGRPTANNAWVAETAIRQVWAAEG